MSDRLHARTLRGETARPPGGQPRLLLHFAQISDAHLIDAQSPARAEFFARMPGEQPGEWPFAGAFRAHETLSAHLLTAALHTAHASRSMTGGRPMDFLIHTGDACDNAQRNELAWFLGLLDGQTLAPNSGGPAYEGVQAAGQRDPSYYHPDNPSADRYGAVGMPAFPGLLEDALRPIMPPRLEVPWYNLLGNHDLLLQGVMVSNPGVETIALGGLKALAPPARYPDARAYFKALRDDPEVATALMEQYTFGQDLLPVTPDAARAIHDYTGWLAQHERLVRPLPTMALPDRCCYSFTPAGGVHCICLDTVVRSGEEYGALDAEQAAWLEEELALHSTAYFDAAGRRLRGTGAGSERILVFAHHPLDSMTSRLARHDRASEPLLGPQLAALLGRFPAVAALFNGHTHQPRIAVWPDPAGQGPGFWELTAGSLIDLPQQGRLVEVLEYPDGTMALLLRPLVPFTAPETESVRPRPWPVLAGIARRLAALDFQQPYTAVPEHLEGLLLV